MAAPPVKAPVCVTGVDSWGLANFGNTCFGKAFLQMVRGCSPLMQALVSEQSFVPAFQATTLGTLLCSKAVHGRFSPQLKAFAGAFKRLLRTPLYTLGQQRWVSELIRCVCGFHLPDANLTCFHFTWDAS